MRRLIFLIILCLAGNCFALLKNTASQKWIVFAFDLTDNTAKTGDAANITANLRIDGVQNAVDDTNPTELEDGYYEFDITAAESNGDNILIAPASSTGNIQVIGAPMAVWTGVNVVQISEDATAADNLELMYDTTGYTDTTGPASRAQVDNIGAASGGSVNINISEDNTGGAIDPSSAVFAGSVQGATTFANLEAADGVVHDIDDNGSDDIDIVYGCSVGGGRTASEVSILANVDGNNDEIKVKAYDHVGGDWEIIGTVEGSGGTTFKALDLPLLLKHTGTSTELGKVYIRFETDSTTPSNLSADKVLIKAVNIGQSVGYANGRIWVNTVSGVAGTEPFVNGTADNPVNLIASAKNLSTSVGISDFHIINGSTITLAESTTNESYFGDNWTLALGSQDVDEAYFQGAHVSGIGTSSTEVHYEGCDIATMSVQIGHFDFCSFDGTVTHTLAGDYEYHNCYSNIAGAGAPTFTKTSGQAITAEWRNWMDGITVSGLQSGDTITINGRLGTVTLNGADATVEIRGSYRNLVNNLTGSPTVNIDGAWQGSDIEDILADTGTDGVVLVADAITAAKIADDAFAAEHFATNSLTNDALATSWVTEIWSIAMIDLAAGAPSVTAAANTALNWLYTAWRNGYRTDGTNSEIVLYKDDGTTPLVEADIADDGTDFTRQEYGAPD